MLIAVPSLFRIACAGCQLKPELDQHPLWALELRAAQAHVLRRDVDWDTQNGRYRVKLHGEWIVVPDDAVVKEPNRFGPAVVWPYMDVNGATQIRCFMPGAGV